MPKIRYNVTDELIYAWNVATCIRVDGLPIWINDKERKPDIKELSEIEDLEILCNTVKGSISLARLLKKAYRFNRGNLVGEYEKEITSINPTVNTNVT